MTDVSKPLLPHEASPRPPRQTPWKPVLLTVAGLAVLAWIIHFGVHAYHYEETDDAYVTGHLYQVSPQITGQVQAVLVNDNQTVKAGDVLVRLDPLQFTLAVQKARDQLVQAQAQEAEARASITLATTMITQSEAKAKQAEAEVGQTEAELALSKLTLARNEQLYAAGGVIAASDLDNARSAFRTAEASQAANQASLAAAQATVSSTKAGIEALRARIDAAVANVAVSRSILAEAERMLAYTTLTSPADGRVGNKSVEEGNHVAAGQTLMSLASLDAWIMANFKETQLTHMHPGQAVEVTMDTLPSLKLHGTVDSLSPASGSQFALLPPDNATGNFNKVVQRVPVKIVLDAASLKAVGTGLRLGLSVVVNVRVR